MIYLAGDIGGTNSRLILAIIDNQGKTIVAEKSYASADFASLDQVISLFLSQQNFTDTIDCACFGVAGPVIEGTCSITNLPWVMSEQELSITLKIPKVKLINDFIAIAKGVSTLSRDKMICLQQGIQHSSQRLTSHTNAAIIGAGTGLGATHRVWINSSYHFFASEAGHVGFAPENEQQTQLLAWLQQQFSHVSLELVLSGRGLVNIYQFLQQQGRFNTSAEVTEMMKTTDPAQVISEFAMAKRDALCTESLSCFIDIYGSAAANIALHYYPIQEVYIAGGIAAKITSKMTDGRFITAFKNKGSLSGAMESLTINLLTDDKVGLYGALSECHQL